MNTPNRRAARCRGEKGVELHSKASLLEEDFKRLIFEAKAV